MASSRRPFFPMVARVGAAALTLASVTSAQFSGWQEGQVNGSICTWYLPRGYLLRDTIYLDGGSMMWTQGLQTGEYTQEPEENLGAQLLTLNLTKSFDLSENLTALFDLIPKASGAGNNIAPTYLDGGMLGNDARFFMYGGMTARTDAYPDPDEDEVLEYQAYQASPDTTFSPGFVDENLPDDMTRYVAYGAEVSAPSENRAWYFSGLRAGSGGIIYHNNLQPDAIPNNLSHTMIQLTFEEGSQNLEEWENKTLPEDVNARASAEGVFLPVGESGVIVFVGGVTHPEFAQRLHKTDNAAALKSDSEGFMKTIDIYDIAGDKWYKQTTQSPETVPGRAHGCAVMSHARDLSSFNIYYYGGYSAANQQDPYSDDVWILSIPSFTWIKAKSGDNDHGRAGHKCFMPYPDQMMVVGGETHKTGIAIDCLLGGVIQVLNLTSLEWMESYHPQVYGEYGVPEVVQAEIGGGFDGGATKKEPAAGSWDDDDLKDIFEKEYDMDKIAVYYPYEPAASADRPDIIPEDDDDDGGGGGGGLPKWVAPTLGVVLGLVLITAIGVAFLFWRRRKILKRSDGTVSTSDDNSPSIIAWIRGQPSHTKAMTVTTSEDTPNVQDMTEARTTPIINPPAQSPSLVLHSEAPDTQIHELPDSSPKPELHGAHLSPGEVVQRHFATPVISNNPSAFSGSINDQHSTVSKASAVASTGSGPITPDEAIQSPDTPNMAATSRVTSGVSGISEREVGHLRQISEATVSSVEGGHEHHQHQQSMTTRSAPEIMSPLSTISPPTAEERTGQDYITARSLPVSPGISTLSPTRRSLFREHAEDMQDDR